MVLYIWGNSLRTPDEPTTRNRHAKGKTDMKLNYEKHGTHENKVIGRPIGLPLNALSPRGPLQAATPLLRNLPSEPQAVLRHISWNTERHRNLSPPLRGRTRKRTKAPPDGGHKTSAIFSEFQCRPQGRLRVFSVKRQSSAPKPAIPTSSACKAKKSKLAKAPRRR